MGDITCDECDEEPYVAPATGDHDHDAEMWCMCDDCFGVPIDFDASANFDHEQPDHWGKSGARFTCYRCGEEPVMQSSVSMGHPHPKTKYHVSCGCGRSHVGFGWRDIMPSDWKKDMDPTKWADHHDEIVDAIEEHGPLSRDEIGEYVDLDQAGVKCQVIHMQRDNKLDRLKTDEGSKVVTPFMKVEYETGTAPEQIEERQEHSEHENPGPIERLAGIFR